MTAARFDRLRELTEQMLTALNEGALDRLETALKERDQLIEELAQVRAERAFTDEERSILADAVAAQERLSGEAGKHREELRHTLLSRRKNREGALAYARGQLSRR